jgi:hypothetical protein
MQDELTSLRTEYDKLQRLIVKYQRENREYNGIPLTSISGDHDVAIKYKKLMEEHVLLQRDYEELQGEMAFFDGGFFEEVDNLKLAYAKVLQENKELKNLS